MQAFILCCSDHQLFGAKAVDHLKQCNKPLLFLHIHRVAYFASPCEPYESRSIGEFSTFDLETADQCVSAAILMTMGCVPRTSALIFGLRRSEIRATIAPDDGSTKGLHCGLIIEATIA